VPTASAAIRGEHPDTSGETYGVVGTSNSPAGAGMAAANLNGGADLVLDGSVDGEADTRLWEWGVDRASATDESFLLTNSGAGRLNLDVSGDIFGDTIDVEEVKISGSTVIDDTGEWMGTGSTVPCPGCVGSSDIADGSIASSDLGSGSVTGTKIASGAVGASAIRSNAVTNIHLADDAVTGAEILDGSITAADLDSTSGIYFSKDQLYEREVSGSVIPTYNIDLEASCDDANDLPVAGSCYHGYSAALKAFKFFATDWTSSSFPATWTCFFNNASTTETYTAYARIVCLSVP
jgi:hypothetical protein